MRDKQPPSPIKRTWFQIAGYNTLRVLTWFFFKTFFRYRQRGIQNFPASGAAIICANHQSHLDPMLVGSSSPRRMNFLAKKQLFQVWPLGLIIHFLDSIPLERGGVASAGGIKETLKRLKRGEMVLLFPEGTRTPDGNLQPLQPGFIALVKRTQAPIVPVGIDGAFQAWPRSQKIFTPWRRLRLVVGPVITAAEYAELDDQGTIALLQSRLAQVVEEAKQF